MNAWYFFGSRGVRAITTDETGANLPAEQGPWERYKNVQIPDDEEALETREALMSVGYRIMPKV